MKDFAHFFFFLIPSDRLKTKMGCVVVICHCLHPLSPKMKVHWLVMPLLSVAVLVTVVVPTGNAKPLAGTLVTLVTNPHRSLVVTLNVTLLVQPPGGLVVVGGAPVAAGAQAVFEISF